MFSADSRTLAVGSQSGRLYFLDGATLERVAPDRRLTAGIVIDLQVSPDGSILAAMGADGDVTLFDPTTWRPFGKPVVDGLGRGFLSFTDDSLRMYGETGPDYELVDGPRRVGGGRVPDRQHRADARGVGRHPARRTGRADLRLTTYPWRRAATGATGRDRTATDRAEPESPGRRQVVRSHRKR